MSKVGADKKQRGDAYMRSQTFFMKNDAIKNANTQLRESQELHSDVLS